MAELPVVTLTPKTISYLARDVTEALLCFDQVEWWRSRTGESGLFEPATAVAATTAQLVGTLLEPHEASGKVLSLMVNGTIQVDVTFATADPASSADLASEIDAASGLITASDDGGYIKIETVSTGTSAAVEVLEYATDPALDAAPFLGFTTGQAAVGLGVHDTLVSGTSQYFFTDDNSHLEFWYKTRFSHSSTGQLGDFSHPIPAAQVPALPYASLIYATMRLVDLVGRPIVGRIINVENVFLPNQHAVGNNTYGVFRHTEQMVTDAEGFAELLLVRGAKIDFTVDGSGFRRRVEVPTTGDTFDMLDPTLNTDDEFGIQEQQIDFAIRLS